MRKEVLFGLFICIGLISVVAVGVSKDSRDSDIILDMDSGFFAAHAKEITFYKSSKRNCWFTISGDDWVYYNGTIVFNRASNIVIQTHRDLKGSVWVCTKIGWNPLGGEIEYIKDRGYCYITSLSSGKAEIPAAKFVPDVEYILIVELIDSSYIFQYADDPKRDYWININDPNTFDRVEVFGYGPLNKIPFKIVVKE
uniref:Uncharacterized protein n=1 Tax=Geoglobus ahangari TaxID=113653 RepID=A0A7C4W2V2_9EURY